MKNSARVNVVMAGACGLLLAAGTVSPTLAWAESSGGDGVSNSDTVARFDARFRCAHRARFCINGPVLSGNPRRSQNVHVSGGTISNSGSPKNTNGNTNDDTGGTTGAATKSGNNEQHIHHHRE
ncbi:hypothetical protein [Streptomyces sp. NEAU-L66]|uniref:hypothetical protein n=1 Tax=Streptomyces sp. NEAU-L66 TaxID=3390812 RepID=UPI0039C65FF0